MRIAKALLSVVAVVTAAAPVHAACWSSKAAAAAQVREFETMLMVSALRCRLVGEDFLPHYNAFVRQSRVALTEVNDTLRAHFSAGKNVRAGLNAYDGYVTSLANYYGGGKAGVDCYDLAWVTEAAVNTRGSRDELAQLASRAGIEPHLPGGLCVRGDPRAPGVTVAARR